jgi:sarcosine oxidase subunit gamma
LLIAEDDDGRLGGAVEAALAGVAHALTDVSHRQCAIELSGPRAARLLNAGVPLDLDPEAFPIGMVTRTVLLKAEITLWRREAERFRLEVARSFAPYVAAILTASARDQAAG